MTQIIKRIAILVTLMAAVSACSSTKTSESPGQFIDNSAITTKVKAAIMDDPDLKVLQIHVITYKDTVQLSGFVDNAKIISRADSVVRSVEGVKNVQNDLIVK